VEFRKYKHLSGLDMGKDFKLVHLEVEKLKVFENKNMLDVTIFICIT